MMVVKLIYMTIKIMNHPGEKTNEDEKLLEKIGEQLELWCEQCDYETASKADLTEHDSNKRNSFF